VCDGCARSGYPGGHFKTTALFIFLYSLDIVEQMFYNMNSARDRGGLWINHLIIGTLWILPRLKCTKTWKRKNGARDHPRRNRIKPACMQFGIKSCWTSRPNSITLFAGLLRKNTSRSLGLLLFICIEELSSMRHGMLNCLPINTLTLCPILVHVRFLENGKIVK
jgi:hypothetical protein